MRPEYEQKIRVKNTSFWREIIVLKSQKIFKNLEKSENPKSAFSPLNKLLLIYSDRNFYLISCECTKRDSPFDWYGCYSHLACLSNTSFTTEDISIVIEYRTN